MLKANDLNLRQLLDADIVTIQERKAKLEAELDVAARNFEKVKAELAADGITPDKLKTTRARLAESRTELEDRVVAVEEKARKLLGGKQ